MHPIGLSFRVDMHNNDWRRWSINYVWFRGSGFRSLGELRRLAAENQRTPQDRNPRLGYSVLDQRRDSEWEPSFQPRGPRTYMPDGRRYTVRGHHVDWQGWEFSFNLRSVVGLQLHDVRFKGERVAYEISLSELAVIYGGGRPAQLHSVFLDSEFLVGAESFELFPGVDCPHEATYFDFAHYFALKPSIYKNSACLFEWRNSIPLRRHYESDHAGGYYFWQGMPDNVLVLRAFVNVYNYDYLLDYTFHQNGVIEVSCSLSGYILSSFYTGRQDDKYGFVVAPDNLGQVHNHLVNFKVDLDVIHDSNRFQTLDIGTESAHDSAMGTTVYAQTMERRLRETERDAAVQYDFDTPKYYLFSSSNETNRYGNARSYRLVPDSMSKQKMPPRWQMKDSYSWARYQVRHTPHDAVTEELTLSSYVFGNTVVP